MTFWTVKQKLIFCNSFNTLDDCPDTNQEFNECGSPCQLTCDNFSRKPRVCPRKCISGCFCKDGFVWDQAKGQCIRPDQCKFKLLKLRNII